MSAYVCPKCGSEDVRGRALLSWFLNQDAEFQSLEKNVYFCPCGFESSDLSDFDPDSQSGNIILYWLNRSADELINGTEPVYRLFRWINEDVSRFNEEARCAQRQSVLAEK